MVGSLAWREFSRRAAGRRPGPRVGCRFGWAVEAEASRAGPEAGKLPERRTATGVRRTRTAVSGPRALDRRGSPPCPGRWWRARQRSLGAEHLECPFVVAESIGKPVGSAV